jgi:hypothetical protein
MDQFSQPLFETGFVSGVTTYMDEYPGEEAQARIVVSVIPENWFSTPMILDTGAPWCILDPEIAAGLGMDPNSGFVPKEEVSIRGVQYHGGILRMQITVTAAQGNNLVIQAPVFIPILPPEESWNYPNFIGINGFLSWVRFAIDPGDNSFYFAESLTE